ncbi:MAG TPA: hypothetical protein VLP43_12385 [Solirubrobacteraceae bacterium]|nr:hypothetical protein [Solirubrobacteraceae bacterium]
MSSLAGIDGGALFKLLYSSLIAVVSLAIVFSLAIYGATRAGDMRRAGRSDRAGGYAVLGTVALGLAIVIAVVGLVLVAHGS